MKISFLVTYYNQAQYVKNSLDSILSIDLPAEWEIIVGDDGSTDETRVIVNEYIQSDPEHIRMIVMPREAGKKYNSVSRASENRLSLLENCTGDCFCALDGDDFYIDRNFVRDAVTVFEQDKSVSVVSFGYTYYENGTFGRAWLLPVEGDQKIDTKQYVANWYLHAGACVYRKTFGKERIDFIRKTAGTFDDNDIVMNALFFGDMYYFNRSCYAYRQEEGSVYSSMNQAEKALLNITGIDSGNALLGASWESLLTERFHNAAITVFYWRHYLLRSRNEKILFYIRNLLINPESISWKILYYDQLKGTEKTQTRQVIRKLIQQHKEEAAKIRIKYILRGLL